MNHTVLNTGWFHISIKGVLCHQFTPSLEKRKTVLLKVVCLWPLISPNPCAALGNDRSSPSHIPILSSPVTDFSLSQVEISRWMDIYIMKPKCKQHSLRLLMSSLSLTSHFPLAQSKAGSLHPLPARHWRRKITSEVTTKKSGTEKQGGETELYCPPFMC